MNRFAGPLRDGPRRELEREERRGRHEHENEGEDEDLARARAADGEELRVPSEQVEERLREGYAGQPGELREAPHAFGRAW